MFDDISKDFKKLKELPKKENKSDEKVIGIICQSYKLVMREDEYNISNPEIWGLAHNLGKYIFSQDQIVEFCRNHKTILFNDKMSTVFLSRDETLGKIVTVRSENHSLSVYYEELGDLRIVPFIEIQVIVITDTIKSK